MKNPYTFCFIDLKPIYILSFLLTIFLLFSCQKDNPDTSQDIDDQISDNENSNLFRLQSEFANERDYKVVTDDIFAIWWDPKFDHDADLEFMFNTLKNLRQDCLNNLGMQDPPNVSAEVYFNIYIHHGEDDNFPNEWANGVGTNEFDLPYMTLPDGAHVELNNLLHEGFHVFQYSANSPGFEYSGDTAWYVESSAQWYAVSRNPGAIDTFIEIETLTSNPHLALWHSFDNEAPGDPTDWLYQVRQYAMQAWLYYMTEVEGVDQNFVTSGFYSNTSLSPQAYHYENVGGELLRSIFANWAARNTLEFDYLTPEQVARAREELNNAADPDNRRPFALTLRGSSIEGIHTPPENLRPRGWAYNVIKLENMISGTYEIQLSGNELGSEGAINHLEGRFITKGKTEVIPFQMETSVAGNLTLQLQNDVEEAYIIVASVPEFFETAQSYNYELNISVIDN